MRLSSRRKSDPEWECHYRPWSILSEDHQRQYALPRSLTLEPWHHERLKKSRPFPWSRPVFHSAGALGWFQVLVLSWQVLAFSFYILTLGACSAKLFPRKMIAEIFGLLHLASFLTVFSYRDRWSSFCCHWFLCMLPACLAS